MKNILIITSSYRKNSNSNQLAEHFKQGAEESGNQVEVIDLSKKQISFCRGCMACQKIQKCVIKDDAVEIAEKMLNSDVLVFVTPIYYYSVSGQLKTMLDRANPLYSSDYKFRDIYLLATAAEEEASAVDGAIQDIKGWVSCFENAKFTGVVFAGGVNDENDIEGHCSLTHAYEIGKMA